ncbi:conserved protein of unknown function [Bartonella clarridgeiae 73]|uniref:Uncharacterized protein n=1 Tax=Bartonella clarridgeiae (strain CCUG 45776 / CIP 104772 / 73) TaxID=696125 RepID=E6YIK6_BARC7|nr:hypothetical protein [Bartonella clarridgeiae]WCR54741.1 MAG: hypothetical protein PG977_000134 [Bartonella clarridgeiae]CBI76694.1 conserved protein of unknown function [Bartonella clarridgeiae 73]
MQKNTPSKRKKQILLAIPETCYQKSSLFSIPDLKLCFYRIKPAYQCNIEPQDKPILYAPSFLILWAVQYTVKNPHLFSSILCHRPKWYSTFLLMWYKLRLKNECRLIGSDVQSPMITKVLRKHIAVADYHSLLIGKWLQLMENYHNYRKDLSIPLFWFDNDKMSTDIHQIISKLQDET